MKRALFLDRDGVLDELVFYEARGTWEAPQRVELVRIVPAAPAALRRAREAGWLLFVVSNQPDAAKGRTTIAELRAVHDTILRGLGVAIDDSFLCFHHPEGVVEELRVACECRKPGVKSLRDAAARHDVDLHASWMLGDQDTDLACGRAAGCRVALIETPQSANKRGRIEPDARFPSIAEAIEELVGT